MKVSCPSCGTNYNIDDKRIPPGGAKLKCAKCQSTFPIKRDAAGDGPVPAPRSSAGPKSGAVPLPGAGTILSRSTAHRKMKRKNTNNNNTCPVHGVRIWMQASVSLAAPCSSVPINLGVCWADGRIP